MGRIKKVQLDNIVKDINKNISDIDKIQNDEYNVDEIKESKRKQIQRQKEMLANQLDNVSADKKLRPNDIHRIIQHTDTSIFDEEKCCIWNGYITNLKNKKKGTYINFYFRDKKKVALHRLLYENYKGNIENTDYIKYSCNNKGKCCNINHMVKFEYNQDEESNKVNKKEPKKRSMDRKKKKAKEKDFDFNITIF